MFKNMKLATKMGLGFGVLTGKQQQWCKSVALSALGSQHHNNMDLEMDQLGCGVTQSIQLLLIVLNNTVFPSISDKKPNKTGISSLCFFIVYFSTPCTTI